MSIEDYLVASRTALEALCSEESARAISRAGDLIADQLAAGAKVMTCGNGGSAADAQHFAAELVGLFTSPRAPIGAVALSTDSSVLTAVANDFGFDQLFSRQVEALGREGDVLLILSGSGNSENVVKSAMAARSLGIHVVAVVGPRESRLDSLTDVLIRGCGPNTTIVQQTHVVIFHALCEAIESGLGVGKSVLATEGIR